jgi:inosine-uridine nucleoside N-ribohydrolase
MWTAVVAYAMTEVLFDTDPGCDDAVMLAMALERDEIEVVGLSTVAGNTTVENATRNALSILALADRTDVPVAEGCHRPLASELHTAEWIHGDGGIRGDLPAPDADPIDQHGAEFIVEQARERGEDLSIAAVGPATNLAVALAMEPALPESVEDIYVMGGSVLAGGNATPMAEANFRNDPAAARRVVQDGRIDLVGLDVTTSAVVPQSVVDEYVGATEGHEIVGEWLDYPEEIVAMSAADGPAVHDAAVVADIAADVLSYKEYYLDVDTSGGLADGAVSCDRHGVTGNSPNASVAVDIDAARFRELVVDALESFADRID